MTLVKHRDLAHLGYSGAIWALRCLPRSLRLQRSDQIAERLGALWYRLDGAGVAVARRNVQGLLGRHLTDDQVDDTVRAIFRNIARHKIVNDILSELAPDDLSQIVHVEGLAHLKAALAHGRGVVFLGTHFGLYGYVPLRLLEREGYPAVGVLGEEIDAGASWVYRHVVSPLRHRPRARLRVIAPNGTPQREMADCLRRNGVLMILGDVVDEDIRRQRSPHALPAPLLGRTVAVNTGPYRLARWLRSPVVPFFVVPRAGGFTLVIEPPLPASDEHSMRGLTADLAAFMARFEPYLLRYPELWAHWRRRTLLDLMRPAA
jgi:lauroyl/myristoyl acyltransferase